MLTLQPCFSKISDLKAFGAAARLASHAGQPRWPARLASHAAPNAFLMLIYCKSLILEKLGCDVNSISQGKLVAAANRGCNMFKKMVELLVDRCQAGHQLLLAEVEGVDFRVVRKYKRVLAEFLIQHDKEREERFETSLSFADDENWKPVQHIWSYAGNETPMECGIRDKFADAALPSLSDAALPSLTSTAVVQHTLLDGGAQKVAAGPCKIY